MTYAQRIRILREKNSLTQSDIAMILDTSQTMYSRYERGLTELPIRHLIVLSKYYGKTTDYILGLSD